MTTVEHVEKRFEAPGRPALAYEESGDPEAPAVILLHGLSGDRHTWFDCAPRLAIEYRVLSLDQRGHGGSDRAKPDEYRLEHYCEDLVAFVEEVVGHPAALVGHSLGGIVSAHVAATRPDLVRKAFLEDPPLLFEKQQWEEATVVFGLLQGLVRDLQDRDATVADVEAALRTVPSMTGEGTMADDLARLGEGVFERFATAWLACDPEVLGFDADFPAVYDPARPMACPVLLLRADPTVGPPPAGAAFLPEHEEPFLATHPQARVQLVEGAGHGIHFERPDVFREALETFLRTE